MTRTAHKYGLPSQLRRWPAMGIFCLLLLFVQSADLIHNHQGDLQKQFDCEVCLKVASFDDSVATASYIVDVATLPQASASLTTTPVFLSILPRHARGPPALS